MGDRQIKMGTAVTWRDMVRSIATARIVMPQSMVRLSAGRMEFSQEARESVTCLYRKLSLPPKQGLLSNSQAFKLPFVTSTSYVQAQK